MAGTTQLWDVDPHTGAWVARHGTAEEAAAAATTLSSRWRGKRARAQFEGPGGGRDVIDARGRIQESEARGDRLEKEVRHLRTSLGESPLLERGPVPELVNLMKEFMQVSLLLLPPSSSCLLLLPPSSSFFFIYEVQRTSLFCIVFVLTADHLLCKRFFVRALFIL